MRKSVFKIHSWLAMISFIPILIISLTGSVLVFKSEIDHWQMPEKTKVGVHNERIPLDVLHLTIRTAHPDYIIGTWEIFSDDKADTVYLIKSGTHDWYKVHINQYSGKILSRPVGLHSDLTDWLLNLHYTFLLHDAGLLVASLFAITFVVLGITGIVLYRRFWVRLLQVRWRSATVVLFTDLHKFVGILSSPVILILGITGVYWNIAEFVHEYTEHTHESKALSTAPYNLDLPFQSLVDQSTHYLPRLRPTYLVFAYEPDMQIMVFGHMHTTNPLYSDYSSGVIFDKSSGNFISTWDIRTMPTLDKVVDSFRELHFGTFGGIWTQIIWCIVGLAPVVLSITGIYVWMVRHKKIKPTRTTASIS